MPEQKKDQADIQKQIVQKLVERLEADKVPGDTIKCLKEALLEEDGVSEDSIREAISNTKHPV